MSPILPSPSLPGKTSPRIFADLEVYIPWDPRNSLTQLPPQYPGRAVPQDIFKLPTHLHEFVLLEGQSVLPQGQTFTFAKVSTVCQLCRKHFDIQVEYPQDTLTRPCPSEGYPLHHFRYQEDESRRLSKTGIEEYDWEEANVFLCSAPECGAKLNITSRPPRLTKEEVTFLTDAKVINSRLKKTIAAYPEKAAEAGLQQNSEVSPYEVLGCQHSYVYNALQGFDKPIPRLNKKALFTAGPDGVLFEKLKFTLVHEAEEELWYPPSLESNPELSSLFEDVCFEIRILMARWRHTANNGKSSPVIPLAERNIKNLLASSKYEQSFATLRSLQHGLLDNPRYASLGAMQDFRDELLLWAHNRQKTCDPRNAPYYLECLEDLAEGRRSESLIMEVVTMKSQGEFTISDVRKAYRSLGLDYDKNPDKDLIIGHFQNYMESSPGQEYHHRENLCLIGRALGEQAIIDFSIKKISDINEAYQFLGVSDSTDDGYILSMYRVRIEDNPSDEGMAKDALRCIAIQRQSAILLSFLEEGAMYESPLDISVAYSRLGIPDRTTEDEMIIAIYKLRLQDGGCSIQELREALRAIGEDRNSLIIKSFLKTGATEPQGRDDWPVGLENIGNTCYLNSLLQFYFTVRQLRDMALDYEKYQVDLTDESSYSKQVGGRKVSESEVKRAKEFVEHLRTLFRSLISTPNASVTPEYELAFLALVSGRDETKDERKRMSLDILPPLITVNNVAAEKQEEPNKMDIDDSQPVKESLDDGESEATLVESVLEKPSSSGEDFVMIDGIGEAKIVEDKENQPPKKEAVATDRIRPVLQDVEINEIQPTNEEPVERALTPPADEPDNPPPIPPRPQHQHSKSDRSYMFGRQQDVGECIENVMFQIEAAVKPDGFDENGEQIDLIKNLFYGKTKQYLDIPNSIPKTELFSQLYVDVADGDRDIYSALDSYFDVATVDLDGRQTRRYLSISQLPPILQIQVQRVQFDRNSGRAFKSEHHLQFPETIYMDRYLDTQEPEEFAKREECWKWKAEFAALEKRKTELTQTPLNIGVSEMLRSARGWLSDIGQQHGLISHAVASELLTGINNSIDEAEQELQLINERLSVLQAQISSQFDSLKKHGYRVHSVFIHRGSASFGHYWIYIYDFKEKFWRKYNDEYVSKVDDINEVFSQEGRNPATPYFLMFVREDQTDIMESVKRVINAC